MSRAAAAALLSGLLPAAVGCGTEASEAPDLRAAIGDLAPAAPADLTVAADLGDGSPAGKDCRCGQPGCGACPAGKMISIEQRYEIDATEVTIAAYSDFVAAGVTLSGQPKACEGNQGYVPACADGTPLPGRGYEMHPVACVDWCDATAYCKWAGKHLCRAGLVAGEQRNEWVDACQGPGPNPSIYPYGDLFNAQVCNVRGNTLGKGQTWEAGVNGCESSHHPGLFDLSGNVMEWSSCSDDPDVLFCPLSGGSYAADASTAGCMPGAETPFAARQHAVSELGFRCCR